MNSKKIEVMGIINITDNSYFEDSRCLNYNGTPNIIKVLKMAETHLKNGASIIDIGACSTRPGANAVGSQEELNRLIPVLKAINKEFSNITLSIDTYWSTVVQQCYDTIGNFIVNDISSGEDDDNMLKTVGNLGLKYIAMHKRGNAITMQSLTNYGEDIKGESSAVVKEIAKYFIDFASKAKKHNIKYWILDPGFGFAKTIDQNYQILKELNTLTTINQDVLVGISRKSMIFKLFNIAPQDALPATQALHLEALIKGASILRVHDCQEAMQVVKIYQKLYEN